MAELTVNLNVILDNTKDAAAFLGQLRQYVMSVELREKDFENISRLYEAIREEGIERQTACGKRGDNATRADKAPSGDAVGS